MDNTLDYQSKRRPRRSDWLGHTMGHVRPMVGTLYGYGVISLVAVGVHIYLLACTATEPAPLIWASLVWNAAGTVISTLAAWLMIRGNRTGIWLGWLATIFIALGYSLLCLFLILSSPVPLFAFRFLFLGLIPLALIVRGLLSVDLKDHVRTRR